MFLSSRLGYCFHSNHPTAKGAPFYNACPTQGSQKDQPNASLANVTNAQWYYQAMVNWANSNGVNTVIFEAYDEPWKGPADGSDSEAFFGMWKANGTASDRGHYTLNGVSPKYPIGTSKG